MRIPRRADRRTPEHAPSWARSAHWPAAAVVLAPVILIAAMAPSPHPRAQSDSPVARPAGIASVSTKAGAADLALGAQPASTFARTTSASRTESVESAAQQRPPAAAPVVALAADGIPVIAATAYRRAARQVDITDPHCGIPWPLLAAIGRVESDHGRFAGAVLRSDGTSTRKVVGIALNGHGTALIRDTDHGRLDGDVVYDRAVGPMQFIPSTWSTYGTDGNADHRADPFNIFDAAAAAAHYLCVAGGNLRTLAGQTRAVLAYNQSSTYLAAVLGLERSYAAGVPGLIVPSGPAPTAPPVHSPTVPPVNPGPPVGLPTAAPAPPTVSRAPASGSPDSSTSRTAGSCATGTSPSKPAGSSAAVSSGTASGGTVSKGTASGGSSSLIESSDLTRSADLIGSSSVGGSSGVTGSPSATATSPSCPPSSAH